MNSQPILNIPPLNPALQNALADELSITRICAQVLVNRGIFSAAEGRKFLQANLEHMHDPFLFPHMSDAVSLVRAAIQSKRKILVHGDYDVDGITSLTLLRSTLLSMGASVDHHIPHRLKEGYGLHKSLPLKVREKGVGLLITADCGTNCDTVIKEVRDTGADVLVTDHHESADPRGVSPANIVINPKLGGSSYPYRDLAGVGVAYKFCQALTGSLMEDDLDLVALGTIADSVPLTGENRVIAKEGLLRISGTKRVGLRTLIESSGIGGKILKPDAVSFILGPRINASGRMDTADTAFNLLSSSHAHAAAQLALEIEQCNRKRQKVESAIMEEALAMINADPGFHERKIIVLAKEGWHLGVLGIVASKLVDKFGLPVILISINKNVCRGSGRSVNEFHLFEGIAYCRDLLDNFGGHQHAIGMVIQEKNIGSFKDRLNEYAVANARETLLCREVKADMELDLGDINDKLLRELESLAPFGEGNPKPLFVSRSLRLKGQPRVMSRDTLKIWITDGQITHQAIGFGMGKYREKIVNADFFDLVYNPRIDSWLGQESTILEIEEILLR